ncbi:hypothetical protein VOLCADRAFT_93420 [Volvox carteri f. nagariensis]|uniref:Sulfotransferase n=1 Tax=Volvox carteri f. nagariensis TaxID=3068 RepID=D8U229_VOLCA|nr:uncharacterized protein VOLCADRAFT_93420 [Volvox carteri f. nagariensis]EFJ46210.1 hypothetical protein VOLCADRAFT_93420 [Volvox carteri f. nagariensis]|eukprot:XP_002952657.1 hypothetical protein VOLCADRAFT_93420 [Volvox carteri f. nagariensis]
MERKLQWRRAFLATLFATAIAFASALKGNGEFKPNQPGALPTILIIGTAKGGTTDLFKQLTDESVNKAPGRVEPPFPVDSAKEPAMLGRGGVIGSWLLPQRALYFEYLQQLNHPCSNTTTETLRECLATRGLQQLTLDATPDYSFSVMAPIYLRLLSPLSKVVMMMREPVERVEVLYRHYVLTKGQWLDHTVDTLASNFFLAISKDPVVSTALERLADCPPTDLLCLVNNWRDLWVRPIMDSMDYVLFISGLYNYMMAPWRYHYFQPGRAMVIDSQAYYERRVEVMEEVIRFMYGRPMSAEERTLAASEVVWRKVGMPSLPGLKLSPPVKDQLTEFYDKHVMKGFYGMLAGMRAEGVWVVGFDQEPWNNCPGFAEFNNS